MYLAVRYPRKARPFKGDIPPITDPGWRVWTRPLLRYLSGGWRTWPQLRRWAKDQDPVVDSYYLRNQLAWLEEYKLAISRPLVDGRKKRGPWVWTTYAEVDA